MKRIFLSLLVIAAISLIPLLSSAQEGVPKVCTRGQMLGDVSFVADHDGKTGNELITLSIFPPRH